MGGLVNQGSAKGGSTLDLGADCNICTPPTCLLLCFDKLTYHHVHEMLLVEASTLKHLEKKELPLSAGGLGKYVVVICETLQKLATHSVTSLKKGSSKLMKKGCLLPMKNHKKLMSNIQGYEN